MTAIAILDFETTGMRAGHDRVIEVAAAIWRDGVVVDTFTQLMDPGFPIPGFITGLTGISTAMVRGSPPPEAVMPRLRAFLGDLPCLAHNAAFDRRFYDAEMARAAQAHERAFLCSVLLARRLVPEAPSHRLGDLARHLALALPPGMRAHRALADVLVTAELWNHLVGRVRRHCPGRAPDAALLAALMRTPKAAVGAFLAAAARPAGGG